MVESQQRLFGKCGDKLDREKWIAGCLVLHQPRKRCHAFRIAMKRGGDQLLNVLSDEGREDDVLHESLRPSDRFKLVYQRAAPTKKSKPSSRNGATPTR
jgi:hypothetical protein